MELAGELLNAWVGCELGADFARLGLEATSAQEAINGSRGAERKLFMGIPQARNQFWHNFRKIGGPTSGVFENSVACTR
jgi:hypothetical protein